ncbi:hypothetical protein SLS58_006047 [Diplodia intermedia]|uniref:Uncharacterized protein n=1 Tax=Diplodia intermedia TaxID=856260 RepID=A0ABR3TPC3_9PEZI
MDCLCAVIWIGLMRARWQRGRGAGKADAGEALEPHETTRFNIAVDARRRLQPPLPDTYMGNAFVVAVAQARVEDVIGTAISRTIATAALRIRQAINSVDDAYIRRRFNFAASLCARQTPAHVSPGDCGTALHRALDPARAGVDCSSWIDFPVTHFRIPGTTTTMTTDGGQDGGEGRPAWVRKTYSANPGAVNVLPRRGGTKGSDEDEWEVLVAAAEVDVERMVKGMEGCRGFVGVV